MSQLLSRAPSNTNAPGSLDTTSQPSAVAASRRKPIPRAKSPVKTFLQSPAKRHPSLGPVSSPAKGSIYTPAAVLPTEPVIRKLDFTKDSLDHPTPSRASPLKSNQQPKSSSKYDGKLTNGTRLSAPAKQRFSLTNEIDDEPEEEYGVVQEDSYQMADGGDNGYADENEIEEEQEQSPLPEIEKSVNTKKRPRSSLTQQSVGKKATGRPRKVSLALLPKGNNGPEARDRSSGEEPDLLEEPEEALEEPPAKKPRVRGRPPKSAASTLTAKAKKPQAAKQKRNRDSGVSIVSSPIQVQRGPPRPNHSRGLFTLRRETPDNVYGQTRSGRNVVKPAEWWNNEKIIYEDEEVNDNGGAYLVRTVKEVIRAEPIEVEKLRRGRKKGTKVTTTKRRREVAESEDEEDELEEPWESEPGRIFGGIRTWNPDDQIGVESQEKEDEIALSAQAIITRDIPGATFRFAKTLTHPFFGSGMVDLPPGAAKKPKNSRKMQMVFFVHTGRVSVTVNENTFRIGKGGMWQVPRGNSTLSEYIHRPYSTNFKKAIFTALRTIISSQHEYFLLKAAKWQRNRLRVLTRHGTGLHICASLNYICS